MKTKLLLSLCVFAACAAPVLPVFAGEPGYSYCVVLNDASRKVFASTIFQREKGAQQETDGAAFAAAKRLDQPGSYDPAPPALRISCNWDATLEEAKTRLKNTEGQARKNNLGFLGIGWSPAPSSAPSSAP